MYGLYRKITKNSTPLLLRLLDKRCENGKEDQSRVDEKKAIITKNRPAGQLIWLHAASIGEAQSALILIDRLLADNPKIHILITTITRTSAQMMEQKLPQQAFHQFCPLDHPDWVETFLDHWEPDIALWMESELWPNILMALQNRKIPAVLVNAKLSTKSFGLWRLAKPLARQTLSAFTKILTQTEKDKTRFNALCDVPVMVTDNIKYSAHPLPCDKVDLKKVTVATTDRPIWLFASTHKGEEEMACRIHQVLKNTLPDLLTIIVPRHPERRGKILEDCEHYQLNIRLRTQNKDLPQDGDDIYIADTLGELGLFYRLSPIACIGRTFSDDGGGGHNPIEAAQLGCCVLHGPNVQYLQEIFDDMDIQGASLHMSHESHMTGTLLELLTERTKRESLLEKSLTFSRTKAQVIDAVMEQLTPLVQEVLAQGSGLSAYEGNDNIAVVSA